MQAMPAASLSSVKPVGLADVVVLGRRSTGGREVVLPRRAPSADAAAEARRHADGRRAGDGGRSRGQPPARRASRALLTW